MRLLIINPNSTAAMTETIARQARGVIAAGTEIRAVNPKDTPPAIQGPEDGEACLPGLFRIFESEVAAWKPDAIIIACFDDTGLDVLKARATVPVIGIGEAAFHAAMLLGTRFSVVTTLPISVPVIDGNITRYGFAARCAAVRAAGVAVLELEDARDSATASIDREIGIALVEDRADAIVLGCAGMAGLAEAMQDRHRVPVVDGVTAAVLLCEALCRLQAAQQPTLHVLGAEQAS